MSNIKYLEMEDIAYKEWSDHLDFVASSRVSPWLPAYGYHPPSSIQEIFHSPSDPFISDNASINQQPYLVLETIVEETSDDLCSESDKSGPTGWNSDSDTDSVIHMPRTTGSVEGWRSQEFSEVPKKRRRRITNRLSMSDDEEPLENVEATSLSSRSSSLITFESLEKHCEDVLVTVGAIGSYGSVTGMELSRWATRSLESAKESLDEFESSDDEHELSSSADTLDPSCSVYRYFRSSLKPDARLRSYKSFDSLNLFENASSMNCSLSELSQSQNALDREKEELQNQEFMIKNQKLTSTTADLSIMSDPYDNGLIKFGLIPRRRRDFASFHYKQSIRFRGFDSSLKDEIKEKGNFVSTNRKSYSVEGLKLSASETAVNPNGLAEESHGKSEPCLNAPSKSQVSTENLSEDSGFDDHISSKNKVNIVNFRTSVSSIPENEDASLSESSSFNFSDSNGSEEGTLFLAKQQQKCKNINKDIKFLKITETKTTEARSLDAEGDVDKVKFNPSQSQSQTFKCKGGGEKNKKERCQQQELKKIITSALVSIASPNSDSFDDHFCTSVICTGVLSSDNLPSEKQSTLNQIVEDSKTNIFSQEYVVRTSAECYANEKMNTELNETNCCAEGVKKKKVSDAPFLSCAENEEFNLSRTSTSSRSPIPPKRLDEDNANKDVNTLLDRDSEIAKKTGAFRGVHFCPVVSEVSWQEAFTDESSNISSDPSVDEFIKFLPQKNCEMKINEEKHYEIEEKFIPRTLSNINRDANERHGEFFRTDSGILFKNRSDPNLAIMQRVCSESPNTSCDALLEQKRIAEDNRQKPGSFKRPRGAGNFFYEDVLSYESKRCDREKPVTPPIHCTPTSDHVFVNDPVYPYARIKATLSVSESNLPLKGSGNGDRCLNPSNRVVVPAPSNEMSQKKCKSRFGGFFEKFSLRGFGSRKTNLNPKKQIGEREGNASKHGDGGMSTPRENVHDEVTIIPLRGPESEAEVNKIFRSVVTHHVVFAKPPLPPILQRLPGSSRKNSSTHGTVSVELHNGEVYSKQSMPGIEENVSPDNYHTHALLNDSSCNVAHNISCESGEKTIGLLETDLDTQITVESAHTKVLVQNNVHNKKSRSLMNLGLSDMSIIRDEHHNLPLEYLKSPTHKNHVSVATDDRAKSMEFLLDKENQAAVLPPENELQKGGATERVMSEHQLRVQRSLQKLNIPDWYKSSALAQTPQGFLLKRNSEIKKEHRGWPGLGSKTTSLSSLGTSQSATGKNPVGQAPSPSPTPQLFTRWSTSRLNSGYNSSSTSPSGSARSSFSYRQPYLGWRSQEKLTKPRTPAERLAAGLLPLQKQQNLNQSNRQCITNVNISDVRSSIKEVTSAIVHYVSGVQEEGFKEAPTGAYRAVSSPDPGPKWQSSPKGSSGKLFWLESSFVGSRPLDQPETPLTLREPSPVKTQLRTNELYLDLRSHLETNHTNCNRLNEGTPGTMSIREERRFEKTFEFRKRPSPSSTTLDDILESLLGLPPASRSPSPSPLSVRATAAFSPGRSRPLLPLPEHRHQRHSCGDIRESVSESASDPGSVGLTKDVMTPRRKNESDDFGPVQKWTVGPKTKGSLESSNPNKDEVLKKEFHPHFVETMVKCRYSKCGKTATIMDAKRTFKTCHNCSHVYCSRECRRAHWERHRRNCLHSRVGALCRQVLTAAKGDAKAQHHLSLLARRGYLTHGRGAVKIFFSSPEFAEKFISRGYDELGEPAYMKWSDFLPAEMGSDLFAELVKICKTYNPDTRFVLYVAVCVVSEVPTSGAVKWERQLVSRCCKIPLDKSLQPPKEAKQIPPPLPPRKSSSESIKITREMENPETLILTSLPGISGKIPQQKIRQISFVNIQRELKQRGVILRRQFPEVYRKLCTYVEGTSEHFTPVTIYPRDIISGKTFMCIIMPDSEPEKLQLVPKDSTRVQTIDISIERKTP